MPKLTLKYTPIKLKKETIKITNLATPIRTTSSGYKPESSPKINVIDAVMGSGKTTAIQNYFNDNSDKCFMYIVPLLTEVTRLQKACPTLDFKEPDNRNQNGTKLTSLLKLITDCENIVSTHSLFGSITPEIIEAMEQSGKEINLVIDESLECVHQQNVKQDTVKILLKSGAIQVNQETGLISWNEVDYKDHKGDYIDIMKLCKRGCLYLFGGDFLMFELPPSFLKACKTITVLTYMFEGNVMSAYCKANSIDVHYVPLSSLGLGSNEESIREFKKLITVESMPIGRGGNQKIYDEISNRLAKNWYDTASKKQMECLKLATEGFVKKHRLKGNELIWTTRLGDRTKIAGKGYTKTKDGLDKDSEPSETPEYYGFLQHCAKATNDYSKIKAAMYLIDKHPEPKLKMFLKSKGGVLDKDIYALSLMLQWIWRTRIRNSEPIVLFIPSNRMRNLFNRWLSGESLVREQTQSMAA